MARPMKKSSGTKRAGSMSMLLNSRILSKEKEAATIKRPPTIDISVIKAGEKKEADKNLATK